MTFFVILLSGLVLTNALIYTPSSERLRRDINKLRNDGNEYNTVRKLSLLKRRDVSHLDLAYLPPTSPEINYDLIPLKVESSSESLPTLPSKEFLPPFVNENDTHTSTEKTTNDITETGSETKPAQLSNEYLPPSAKMTEINATLPQSSFNEYLTSNKMTEEFLEKPLETSVKTNEDIENDAKVNKKLVSEISSGGIIETPIHVYQDTAILDEDGYHYKIPNNIPELYLRTIPAAGYLPPMEKDAYQVECSTLEKRNCH